MEVSVETVVDQPPSIVYDFLLDKENFSLWLSGFTQYITISGDDDEVGGKAWFVFLWNKSRLKFLQENLALQSPHLIEMILRHKYVDVMLKIEITAKEEDRSIVNLTATYQPNSILFNLYWLFNARKVRHRHERDLNQLKVALHKISSTLTSNLDL